MRLFAREKGYLNVGTRLLESVLGGHMESEFWASSAGLPGPGSLLLPRKLSGPAFAARTPAAASVMPAPRNPRLERSRLPGADGCRVGVRICLEGRCNFIALFCFHFGQAALGSKLRIDTLGALGICGRRKDFPDALWQA